jgi:hypothetical protein
MSYTTLGVAIAALASGCIFAEPDVGPLLENPDAGTGSAGSGKCVDQHPDVDVSFSRDVRPLLSRSPGGCSCHGSNATAALSLGSYEGLRRGGAVAGVRIIVAGSPCESVLVQKLGVAPPFGARMPLNGPPYFVPEEIALISDWIAEGAHDN